MYKLSVITIVFGIVGSSIALHLLPTHVNKWENGIVPLEITGNYSPEELVVLNAAIDSIHQETCIKFVQRTDEKNYATIQNTHTGCWAQVGQIGGQQMINFQSPQCTEKIGSVQHELIHVLGFVHAEHDDDDFYTKHGGAVVDNVKDAKLPQKEEHEDKHAHEHEHEHEHKHEHEHEHDHEHNHGDKLADHDIENINKMYECKEPTGIQTPFKLTV